MSGELYFEDDGVALWHGDAREVLAGLPAGSVDCLVTSPPYFGLRDYGNDGQYGLEESPAEYVETMRAVFAEARQVLADDGTFWLNLGDSYGKGKQLMGMPWRVAFALQDDGWTLRNAVVWRKPNAMPESVRDRLRGTYEQVFLLTKGERYWFDLDPIREPHKESTVSAATRARIPYAAPGQSPNAKTRGMHAAGANPGDVWDINTKPFGGAHFAVMPPELARRCIVSGCKPGGTVMDIFNGSGTTGMVAQQLGRRYVGIDISADYLRLTLETRLQTGTLL